MVGAMLNFALKIFKIDVVNSFYLKSLIEIVKALEMTSFSVTVCTRLSTTHGLSAKADKKLPDNFLFKLCLTALKTSLLTF